LPEISRFFGIVISMYYNDHLPPHFHARYGGQEVQVYLESHRVVGELPRRALALVLEWYSLHRPELLENWERARERVPLRSIKPLE